MNIDRRDFLKATRATLIAGAMPQFLWAVDSLSKDEGTPPKELLSPNKRLVKSTGLPNYDNHDPSNIIHHDGLYYCWYTEHVPAKPFGGFINTRIQLITSPDGVAWKERGVVMAPDEKHTWDALGALTAYVVKHEGRFYMFYTGAPEGFTGSRKAGRPAWIVVAVADHPMGPWTKKGPVFEVSDGGWDKQHVDDANVLRFNGKWLLYYKGFAEARQSVTTQLGVAISDTLTGSYRRYTGNPILKGHAFSAWKHRDGVALVAGGTGKQVVYWSTDGMNFVPAGPFRNKSTGFYVPEGNFSDKPNRQGVNWGLDVRSGPHKRTLFRFECDLEVASGEVGRIGAEAGCSVHRH